MCLRDDAHRDLSSWHSIVDVSKAPCIAMINSGLSSTCSIFRFCILLITFEGSFQSELDLKRELFLHYDKHLRPVQPNELMNVSFYVEANHLEFEEKKGFLTVSAYIFAKWYDPKLKWTPKLFNNVTELHLKDHEVWLPDLCMYNIGNQGLGVSNRGHVTVSSNGSVIWVLESRLNSLCEIDLFYWPYDTHVCYLHIGSYSHTALEIDTVLEEHPLVQEVTDFPEFEVDVFSGQKEEKRYNCCAEPFTHISFRLEFARRSSAFGAVFLVPSFCVVMLTLSAFWIPPQKGEKILLNGVNIVLISLFVVYFIDTMPTFSLRIPLIALFYLVSFVMVTVSMIISVLLLALSRSPMRRPTMRRSLFLSKIVRSRLGEMLGATDGFNRLEHTELHQNFDEGKSNDLHMLIRSSSLHDDWIGIGVMLDRLSFIAYSFVFALMGVVALVN